MSQLFGQVTDQGHTVLGHAAADVDDVQEAFLRALSATERTSLLKSLKKCLPATRAATAALTATEHKGP